MRQWCSHNSSHMQPPHPRTCCCLGGCVAYRCPCCDGCNATGGAAPARGSAASDTCPCPEGCCCRCCCCSGSTAGGCTGRSAICPFVTTASRCCTCARGSGGGSSSCCCPQFGACCCGTWSCAAPSCCPGCCPCLTLSSILASSCGALCFFGCCVCWAGLGASLNCGTPTGCGPAAAVPSAPTAACSSCSGCLRFKVLPLILAAR